MRQRLSSLWNGREPLAGAFWTYAMLYGTLANLLATGAALAALVIGWPGILALAIHFAPLPYNVLMVVAVWRSADRHRGREIWATLARIAIIAWAGLMTFV